MKDAAGAAMEIKELDRSAPVVCKKCVTSTNTIIKGLVPSGLPDGFVLAAEKQTSGRGRLGRSFESPEGGLYLSMLLYPRCQPEETATLTPCAAVAVSRAIEKVCGVSPEIKWPNDLKIGGKKLCGILTESSSYCGRRYVVIGIGINVNTKITELAPEMREIAASLYETTGKVTELGALTAGIVRELDAMYESWKADKSYCLDEYRKRCGSIGCDIWLLQNGERIKARSLDVDGSFALIVEENGERRRIDFGEISIR